MTDRPSFDAIYLDLARAIARRSTCARKQVGCVIATTDGRQVLAVGYNGNYAGGPNGCDRDEAGNCGDIHAEANAIINCAAPRSIAKVVLVTAIPCPACAKMLINLGGVVRVRYADDYRIRDSLALLTSVGIDIAQMPYANTERSHV